jgi:RNA 2',3'-cyclic 3'-phosphodiesterase
MELVRTFAAISLDEGLKRELLQLQRRLKADTAERQLDRLVRWVAPDNIHLTLKFLGEVQADRIPALIGALETASQGLPPMTLTVRGLGCFPNSRRPSVIWAGLEGDVPALLEFERRVQEAFSGLGFPREPRAFSPHLTLGRINREARPPERAAIGQLIERLDVQGLGFIAAKEVQLFKSDLKPRGPIYSTLASVQLYDPFPGPP